jgi:hypothetical protein
LNRAICGVAAIVGLATVSVAIVAVRHRARPSAPVAAATSPSRLVETPTEPAMRRVSGTIVVRDPAGAAHASESGSFVVRWSKDPHASGASVPVVDGAWTADVPAGTSLSIVEIVLGGRRARWLADARRIAVPDFGALEIRAQWPPPSLLHVRDAASGRELADVELARRRHRGDPVGGASRKPSLATGLSSPIDVEQALPPSEVESTDVLFARSPGFAWGRITLSVVYGGERFLDLPPGGDLDVRVAGSSDVSGAEVCVRRARGALLDAELPLSSERDAVVESVAAGPCVVSVELPGSRVLGEVDANVVAGGRTRIEIDVEPKPVIQRVRIAGTIRVPKAWRAERLDLAIATDAAALPTSDHVHRVACDERRDDAGVDVFAFAAAGIPAGRHSISIARPPYAFAVDDREDLALEVPPPGHVSLRAIDPTGADAPITGVGFRVAAAGGVFADGSARVARSEASHRFEIDAPIGAIDVWCDDPRFEGEPARVSVRTEGSDAELRVRKACGVSLRVVDGDTMLPWDARWPIRLETSSGESALFRAAVGRIVASGPGTFRLSFPKLAGFRAVPPADVVVEAGAFTEHVVHLERER